ncbi:hypothetical protein F4803DRAFT_246227 [Xylaria telfairii]|nr:hypothetical protein F4803DRAFT_246227 [Xylaria telfairii]
MPSLRTTLAFIASSVTILGAVLAEPTATVSSKACMAGAPTVTAGYTISYYVQVTPSALENGYQPESAWADQHLVGTYSFGVPPPVETGFAYAQYKCQYYCKNQSEGGSFFVRGDDQVGSYCECYDELMDPETFVDNSQTLVGAWNAIC